MIRIVTLVAAGFLLCASAFRQTQTSPSVPGKTSPALAHDTHDGLTVQADAYTDRARAKEKFGKANPVEAGILPVEVFLRNESANAIRINLNTIQLEVHFQGGGRQDLNWLKPRDAAYRIAHPAGPSAPRRSPLPDLSSGGDKKSAKMEDILRPLALDADIVPPMATIHGFLYFDLSGDMTLAPAAVLYIPDAALIPSQKPLIFFEVPLGNPAQQ